MVADLLAIQLSPVNSYRQQVPKSAFLAPNPVLGLASAFSEWRVIHPEQSARMRQSTRCRQIVKVDGIEERLYRIRVQVTINDGRWRAGVPIFGHPAPETRTDSPAVLNRIKHLRSEAQLP